MSGHIHIDWDAVAVILTGVVSLTTMVWAGGRWTKRIEASVDHVRERADDGFKSNDAAHERIIVKIDEHGERLGVLEGKVEDHHRRHP